MYKVYVLRVWLFLVFMKFRGMFYFWFYSVLKKYIHEHLVMISPLISIGYKMYIGQICLL